MKKFFPILFLTIISAFLIFYRFTDIPKNLAFDEVEFTKLALSLNNKPYIPYSQLATGHSTLYFYILLASLKTFGINTFALRFPAAIFGILSVLVFYLILKKVFKQSNNRTMKQWFPFLFSIIFLTSRWFLNFSRFSFEATFLLFLELTSIYFLLKADTKMTNFIATLDLANARRLQRSQKNLASSISSSFYLTACGLFTGLAFLSYTPGRIFFLLPLGFLLFKKQWNNETMKQLLLFLIPFVIIIAPLTSYLLTNKDARVDQQFFLKNNEMTVNEKISGLWHNISSTALMFNIKGDVNGRHNYPNKPALNPILGFLFVIGLVTTMKSVFAKASTFDKSSADKSTDKQWNVFFLLYFLLSIIPALMTYPWENPNMLRTFTALPSVIYFVGNAIYYLSSIVQRLLLNSKFKYLTCLRKQVLNTLYLILLFSCLYELRTYFKYQSTVFKQSFEIKLPLEKAIKVKLKP